MAKRQFTSSDTSRWAEKYTNGSAGDKTYASGKTLDSTDGFYNSTFTGTDGATTGATSGIANGTYNLPCKIVQSQGTDATADPNWEFNVLVSVASNVATLKYPLTRNYTSGAQIVTGNPYKTVTINNGVVLAVPAWDGSKGGEFVQFARDHWDNGNGGSLNLQQLGFRGGSSVDGNTVGRQGEGHTNYNQSQSTSANGNGGGGGGYSNNGPWDQGNGGGGGGNRGTPGTGGYGTGGGNNAGGGGGSKGNSVNNSALSVMVFGGGGGSGGDYNSTGGTGAGGRSAGNATIVSKHVELGNINITGQKGFGNRQFHAGDGGSAAGSNLAVFCQQCEAGSSTVNATGGPRVNQDGQGFGDANGGAGDDGWISIHTTKSANVTGTTTPAASIIEDSILNDNRAGASLLMSL